MAEPEFYSLVTAKGAADLVAAQVNETAVDLVQLAVGDGGGASYDPTGEELALVNETYRVAINSISQDPENPNWLVIEAIIPPTEGGWFIREVGVFDAEGDLFAIGKYPETYKPQISQGFGVDLVIRVILEIGSASSVIIQVDPSQILATRQWTLDNFVELPFATPAETEAGVIDDQAVTPAGVAAAIQERAPMITGLQTLYVSPAGVAAPADPIGGDPFDKISSAMDWLTGYQIAASAFVTIRVLAGTYTHTVPVPGHPQAAQIAIVGDDLVGAMPVYADYTLTGSGAADRLADNAANETMIRSRFAVIVECDETSFLGSGNGLCPRIANVAIIGDGVSQNGVASAIGSNFKLEKVAVHGFTQFGIVVSKSIADISGCAVSGCGFAGVHGRDGASISFDGGVSLSNDGYGLHLSNNSELNSTARLFFEYNGAAGMFMEGSSSVDSYELYTRFNGTQGVNVTASSSFVGSKGYASGNGDSGVIVANGSSAALTDVNINNNAQNGLYVRDGGSANVQSPVGSTMQGNGFANIYASGGFVSASGATVWLGTTYNVYAIHGADVLIGNAQCASAGDTNIRSARGAFVYAVGATGTANTSPAINTVGNANAFIQA